MDKLKMQTTNKANENFKKLAAMFPNAITETIDETTGEVVRAIDTTEMRISTENARITIAMPLDMMMELLRICIQRYPYLIL